MGSVNPTTGMAIFIVLAAIISIVCNVVRTVQSVKRKPPIGEDHASMNARLKAVERDVGRKQDAKVCTASHLTWEKDVDEIRTRHRTHETKMSNQIAGIHQVVERGINSLTGKVNRLEGSLETYIKLREG